MTASSTASSKTINYGDDPFKQDVNDFFVKNLGCPDLETCEVTKFENGVCGMTTPSEITQENSSPHNLILNANNKWGSSFTSCVKCKDRTYSKWSVTTNPLDCRVDLLNPESDQVREIPYS